MAVEKNWEIPSYAASMRLWLKRICPDPSLLYPHVSVNETIIKGIHETHDHKSHVLISLVDKHFHDDIDFRKFAFTTTGADHIEINKIAPEFMSYIDGMWTAKALYTLWKNLMELDRKYIIRLATRHCYFVDFFIALPEFTTLDHSKKESYVSDALNFLVECSKTQQGLARPSIRRWLGHDGSVAIKWCLDELSSSNVHMESQIALHQTLLAFYGAQSAKIGHQCYELFGGEQRILIARMLEQLFTKHKYTEFERRYLTACLEILEKGS